jgi:hydrogenase nickel incorporation protein HypA/HybF
VHEVAIATSLLEHVRRHVPRGHRLTAVRVEAGPLQSLDPQALDMAWQAVTAGTVFCDALLESTVLPFDLVCPACGRAWTSADAFEPCTCGTGSAADGPRCTGSADLRLVSLDVESADDPAPAALA